MLRSKYCIPVELSYHAKQRLERGFGISEKCVIRDLRQNIYKLLKEMGTDIYMTHGKIFKYPIVIQDGKIKVITILFKKDPPNKDIRFYKPVYQEITKQEVKKIFKII